GGAHARNDATPRRHAADRRGAGRAARLSARPRDQRPRGDRCRDPAMKVRLTDAPLDRVDADLLVLVVANDKLARLRTVKLAGPALVRALERRRFTGAEGTSVLLQTSGRSERPLAI